MRLAVFAAMLTALSLTTAFAQTGQRPPNEAGQTPPAAQPEPKCVSENTGFRENGKAASVVVELANDCEKRFRCQVNVYVVTAFGPTRGQKTLILAPKSKGAAAKKSFVLKVRQASGSIDQAHNCKAI